MKIKNQYLERLISTFNIFTLGCNDIPHLICNCLNKNFVSQFTGWQEKEGGA